MTKFRNEVRTGFVSLEQSTLSGLDETLSVSNLHSQEFPIYRGVGRSDVLRKEEKSGLDACP